MIDTPNNALQRTPSASPLAPLSLGTFGDPINYCGADASAERALPNILCEP